MSQGSVAGYNPLWVSGGTVFRWELQGHLLLFHTQQWKMGCPRACRFIRLSFKTLKAMSLVLPIELGQGYFWLNISRFGHKREIWNLISVITGPRKPWSWHLVLGVWKLRTPWSLSGSRSSLCSDIRYPKCWTWVSAKLPFFLGNSVSL